jgi:hypothetical protein
MRRFLALCSAGVLVAGLAASSVAAAGQPGKPNSFSGDFDMITGDGTVVAHVVANFREPTDPQLGSGTVDIYWASGDVRESHAQVAKAYFWTLEKDPVEGRQVGGRVIGSLCDYIGPQADSCKPFAMVFVDTVNKKFRNHVGFSVPGSTDCCGGAWYDVGRGDFALTYGKPTPENNLPVGTHDGSTAVVANDEYCYANGWAIDQDKPTARLAIRILADGVEVWTGPADQFRPDVRDAGYGNGHSGFSVSLVGLISPLVPHEIMVEAQDVNTHEWKGLDSTPRTITCTPTVDLSARPLIWFGPMPYAPPGLDVIDGSDDYDALFPADAPWPIAARAAPIFYVYSIWVESIATDEQIAGVVSSARARGQAIALGLPALTSTAECGDGIEGFQASLGALERLHAAGARVSLIAFDEPYAMGHVYDGPRACHWSVEKVAADVAAFVRQLRAAEPGVLIGDIEVLWRNIPPEDIGAWMDEYARVAGAPFDFFHLDVDWSEPDWVERMASAVAEIRSRGLPAGVIYNGDWGTSDREWTDLARSHISEIEGRLGGPPDHVVFMSWQHYPTHVLPETDPLTFTGLLRQYVSAARTALTVVGAHPTSDGGTVVDGLLSTTDGSSVDGARVEATATSLDGGYRELALTGTVPANATKALIGLRINNEGAGPGDVSLSLYEVGYQEGAAGSNAVPDPRFSTGVETWQWMGTGQVRFAPSDRGSGTMLQVDATADQWVMMNGLRFDVTPGAPFRFWTMARVPGASQTAQVLAVIFLGETESERHQLDLEPPPVTLEPAIVSPSGAFTLDLPPDPGRYRVQINYRGDIDHWPSAAQSVVTVN